jgi:1-acyl-sn-glycerol-3-phosphate acyltransferase
MATKGVLGNDPFQRGAAKKKAPASKEKPVARTAAPKPAAPKPATGVRAKKAAAPKGKTAAPKPKMARPGTPVTPPKPLQAERRTKERTPVEEPREPVAPAVPSEPRGSAVDAELLKRAAQALTAAQTLRELEKVIGEPLPTGPLTMPGFEEAGAIPVSEAVVEVLDASQDEYAPSSEAEAAVEARIEVEVEAALAPVPPASRYGEVLFTPEPPGAEPRRLRERFAGLMSLAKEMAFQALTSERLGKTMGSARGLLSAALTGIGMGGGTAIDEYGKDAALSEALHPVLDFLYERYWRVSVQGASHVPAGPVLLVANHSGALPFDGPMLQQALSRERPDLQEARWLAEDQVFYAPMLGTLMNRLGAVRACPENALRLMDELRPVIVFPEGIQGLSKPFAQRYELKRFGRGGFVKLALRTGAPIVPVAIVGAEETVPLLGKIPARFLGIPYLPVTPPPLPARWTIRFGEPINVSELPPEAAEDLSQVQRLTERTRESIQGMLQALLKERRSVFAG